MIDLNEVRIKLDQQTEKIISGLKDRSRLLRNQAVYVTNFANGKTWFEYRLLRDQSVDSEFGRFNFDGQQPLLFTLEQLAKPLVIRDYPAPEIKQLETDVDKRVIRIYQKIIPKICKFGEDTTRYGETVKIDSSNVLSIYERVCGLGHMVAQSKIQKDPSILDLADPKEIRLRLVNPEREAAVIQNALETAERYDLPNPYKIKAFFREIIDATVSEEIKYVQQISRGRNGI